jgi:hypothetical protein
VGGSQGILPSNRGRGEAFMSKSSEKPPPLSNEALEWRYIEGFRAIYPLFPPGILKKGIPGQEPDFFIRFDKNTSLGIELAQLYRDDGNDLLGVARQSIFQLQLVDMARSLFEANSSNRYRVFVSFKERSGITRLNQPGLAQFLALTVRAAVANHSPIVKDGIQIGLSLLHPFENTFSLVQIYDRSNSYDFRWTISNYSSVDPLNEKILFSRISDKEEKLAKGLYGHMTQNWLLLCMDFWNHAMDQKIPDALTAPVHSNGFDKIVIFKTIANDYQVIYPSPTGIPPGPQSQLFQ